MTTAYKPVKNKAYGFTEAFVNSTTPTALVVAPTISASTVKISIDGGAFANIATLPTVTPSGGVAVKINLTATEMNGDDITLLISGSGFCDKLINFQTRDPSFANFEFLMRDTSGNEAAGKIVTAQYSYDTVTYATYSQTITEKSLGIYRIPLTLAVMAAVTDTITFRFTATGCMPTVITLTNAY